MAGAAALMLAPFGSASGSETITYRYDERGRLIQVSHGGAVNNGVSSCYVQDRADNRKKVTVATADCATFSVSTSSVAAVEGATLTFLVSKVGGSQTAFTVSYATSNGTATSGSDYVGASGVLSFTAGETQKAITVTTSDDITFEPDETLILTLSNPSGGATITDSQAVGTILNNDGVSFSINDAVGYETVEQGITLTVTKNGSTNTSSSVNFALANNTAVSGSDFSSQSGTLTFLANETTKYVTVNLIADTITEATETLFVNLSGASSGASISDAQGVATIYDND